MGSRPLARLACPEVVGRDQELATISQLVTLAESGTPMTLLISGEAGLGKTALLGRAVDIARQAGLRVLRAQGERIEMPRAFGPFLDLLSAVRGPGPAVTEALLARPSKTADRAVGSADDRYRTHSAFARAIAEVADGRPLMLVVDDLHWADESSLELFAYLARRRRSDLMLIGAYRPEEVATRRALRHAIEDVPRDRVSELALRPLTATDTSRALRLILGTTFRASRETRELLQAQSRGNPLFLEEMLRALARRGELTHHDGSWQLNRLERVPLPSTVEEAVHERFAGLDDRDRQTVILAAVIGDRFAFDVLLRATDLSETDLLGALRAATRAQIVVEDESREGDVFAFRHALLREAIVREPLARERRALHLRVATALERASEPIDLAGIAYHYEQADDRESAFTFYRRAADEEARQGAYAEASTHYERARDLAPDDDRTRADLSMLLARSSGGLGHRQRTFAAVGDAVTRYERIGDARALASALLHRGNLIRRHMLLRLSETNDVDRQITKLLEPLGDTPELAWHQSRLSWQAKARRDFVPALELARRGVEIARRCGAGWEEGVSTWHVAETYWALGNITEAISWYRQTVALTSRSPENGRMQMEHSTSSGLLALLRSLGRDDDETRGLHARISRLDEDYPGDRNIRRLDGLLYSADWDDFVSTYEDWSVLEGTNTVLSAHVGLHRAFVDVARSGPEAMRSVREWHTRLLSRDEIGPTVLDVNGEPMIASGLSVVVSYLEYVAQAALAAGDHEYTLETLEPLAPFVATPRFDTTWLSVLAIYAVIAATEMGDDAAARRWIDMTDWPEFRPPESWSEGLTLARLYMDAERRWRGSDHAGAIEGFSSFVARAPARNPDAIRMHFVTLRLCDALAARGTRTDLERASRLFVSIVDFYKKAGATWYVERLRERGERLGLPLPSAAAVPVAVVLTKREREVALLVAQGLTNKEIAERLTLSVRTAESHVEQIRAKLGFKTRAQIASWVTERYGATRSS